IPIGTVGTRRTTKSRIAATSLNQNPAKVAAVPAIATGGATAIAAAPPDWPTARPTIGRPQEVQNAVPSATLAPHAWQNMDLPSPETGSRLAARFGAGYWTLSAGSTSISS